MVRDPRELAAISKSATLLAILLALLGFSTRLAAQDGVETKPAPQCPAPAVSRQAQPGLTTAEAANFAPLPKAIADPAPPTSEDASQHDQAQLSCTGTTPALQLSRYSLPLSLSSADFTNSDWSASDSWERDLSQEAQQSALTAPSKYPVTERTGKWGGEEWRPAILQTLGFTLAQNGYRLVTEEKTRHALLLETWHSYWLAVSGLHTWSDGGKTWTVYIAHPAQGAVFNDIWLEHDPHAALVPFGFNKVYWGEHIKSFWWDSVWELQWKFGPFSEASIGNVGLIPGKLGANTIVSSAFIGTGESIGEDMLDRYAIAKWERHTDNRLARAFLRSTLNPDRSFANLFRKKYPWYRDRRPTLRDLEPPLP
jgi:hypothetical protein